MTERSALFPNEPTRFTAAAFDELLAHCEHLKASDITFQSGEPVIAEVYGRLVRITGRRLTHTEVGELLNAIYGPNGTAQNPDRNGCRYPLRISS